MAGEEADKEALSDHAKALEARKDAEVAKQRVAADLKYADEMEKLSQQAHTLSNAEKAAEAARPKG